LTFDIEESEEKKLLATKKEIKAPLYKRLFKKFGSKKEKSNSNAEEKDVEANT
jgi:hypothetical protein